VIKDLNKDSLGDLYTDSHGDLYKESNEDLYKDSHEDLYKAKEWVCRAKIGLNLARAPSGVKCMHGNLLCLQLMKINVPVNRNNECITYNSELILCLTLHLSVL